MMYFGYPPHIHHFKSFRNGGVFSISQSVWSPAIWINREKMIFPTRFDSKCFLFKHSTESSIHILASSTSHGGWRQSEKSFWSYFIFTSSGCDFYSWAETDSTGFIFLFYRYFLFLFYLLFCELCLNSVSTEHVIISFRWNTGQ